LRQLVSTVAPAAATGSPVVAEDRRWAGGGHVLGGGVRVPLV